MIFAQYGVNYHGLRLSADGRTHVRRQHRQRPSNGRICRQGLRILDVSQIQDRVPNPQVPVLSGPTWREQSIPQVAQPFTRNGRHYLLEVDEFADFGSTAAHQADAPVGAARIINVDDPEHPKVVSDLRLAVHQPAARAGRRTTTPAPPPASGLRRPLLLGAHAQEPDASSACSMILSGLRIFDISDLRHPARSATSTSPAPDVGSSAMAQPAWDVKRRMIWFTDTARGFFAIRLTTAPRSCSAVSTRRRTRDTT